MRSQSHWAAAEKYGVTHASTSNNLDEVTRAAILEVKGVKIALIAATTSRGVRDLILPTESSPGVNGVWTGWQEDWVRNMEASKQARLKADFVIYYQHFQINQKDADGKGKYGYKNAGDMHKWQEAYAKAVIDAGAGMFIAHGDRIFMDWKFSKADPSFGSLAASVSKGYKAISTFSAS